MLLQALKRTIARVEIAGRTRGTAFLVDRAKVATARHVLDGCNEVDLVFPMWPGSDLARSRKGTLCWPNPDDPLDHDVAILELEQPCPDDVHPAPWSTETPSEGARWYTWGFPAGVPFGYAVYNNAHVDDAQVEMRALGVHAIQLHTSAAGDDLGGLSGAPCCVGDAIIGIVSRQLTRERVPALLALYALPMALLAPALPPPEAAKPKVADDVGAIESASSWYMHRAADSVAVDYLARTPSLVQIIGPSKTGKSSLLYRLAEEFAPAKSLSRLASIDFLEIGDMATLTDRKLFQRILAGILTQTGRAERIDAWRANKQLAPVVCRQAIETDVLARDDVASLLVTFDNFEVLASRPELSSALQLALGSWVKAGRQGWKKVRIAVACRSKDELSVGPNRTSPLDDAGPPIDLTDFSGEEIRALIAEHRLDRSFEDRLAPVGGHPYMVRRVLHDFVVGRVPPERAYDQAEEFEGALGLYLKMRWHTLTSDVRASLKNIFATGSCTDVLQHRQLATAGIIRPSAAPVAVPRYPLYERVFPRNRS